MKLNKLLILSITGFVSFSSCKKDDPVTPVIPNEEEVITTLIYTLRDTADATNTITLTYRDLDGDGNNAPVISNGILNTSSVYAGSIVLLNETDTNDVENITLEVLEEDEDHQFFFVSTVSAVTYNDSDSLGNPIGVSTILTTGLAATGNLTITLKHEPNKGATGVSDGDMTNAGGETDIEVSFPINVVQ
tara:strand:+ start:120 stop:689 length:570 start_codon:yes stop_codon:yes gene_type:complete